jgi:nucleoside-diphosphate-sugar epimerase
LSLNVLVTGGAGFIGSHLCAGLLEREHQVACVDNLSTGCARNIQSLLSHPQFSFVQHDVTEPLPSELRPEVIFHLASPASVPDYLARPLETLAVNSQGTRAMLDLAERCGARLLFTSTSEIYGDPLVHPQPETYWGNVGTLGPRACYDEAKRFGEALVMAYVRTREVDARIVRIFNTYGPHSRPDDGRIVPNFIMQALRGEPITIYGDGSQTRSFCYVSDMVNGLLAAMFSADTRGEVFNLGNPDEYTVLQFAERIAAQIGSTAGVVYRPLPVDDPTRRCPDITKARRVLNWHPVVDLTTGIARTTEWFRDDLAAMTMAG